MKSIVVVSSLTGNTLKLASAVAYALNNNVEAVKVEELLTIRPRSLLKPLKVRR